ncbi:MAG TPA: condensation domain-containing protein, partial [Thermoanaerobaculia bacterium]|nr:condensation domain-containing protein [Thermoanaerobaculia bacterium]
MLASTSVCFDLSVFELFGPLCSGGTVVLVSDALALGELPASAAVRLVNTVPSAASALVAGGLLPALVETVNLAGEVLRGELVRALHAKGVRRVANLYGPSEDTTYSTGVEVDRGDEREPTIGRPLPGTRALVLGPRGELLGVGVPGELCLGGAGLARGYWGRPGLTAERFVADGWSGESGARVYRTGDRVRWLVAGELEYLGRGDQQVKVRGFRIELGEVEAALAALAGVREGAVGAWGAPGGERELAGWVVLAEGTALAEVVAALRERLPAHLVPGRWVELAALPRTPNGKLDRARLPAPSVEEGERGGSAAAGEGVVAQLLSGIWGELLGRGGLGGESDFFAVGGHSLLAVRLASRVREVLGVELPLASVFAHRTLAEQVAEVERRRGEAVLPAIERRGLSAGPASFGQERLWFLDQLAPGSALYNMPASLRLTGELDVAALCSALSEVVCRHQALRSRFVAHGAGVWQEPTGWRGGPWPVVDLSVLEEGERREVFHRLGSTEARRPFDLAGGRLLRATLARLSPQDHGLVLVVHHIAGDGASLTVLAREVSALYRAFVAGEPSPLAPPAVQSIDHAVWQREQLGGELLAGELGWWRPHLAGAPEVLELPGDRPRGGVLDEAGGWRRLALGPLPGLESFARSRGATPYLVLLASFAALLSRLSGQEEVMVGTPLANRRRPESEGLVAFLVNTLVLRLSAAGEPGFGALLSRVRQEVLGAWAHGDVPLERLVEELAPRRSRGQTPLFQAVFGLQAETWEGLALPGLAVRGEPLSNGGAKFDATVLAEVSESGWVAWWEHRTGVWDATTIERWGRAWARLLEGALADPETPVTRISWLSEAERQQLLVEWNDTASGLPPGTAVGMFERQVGMRPEAVALSGAGGWWSYSGLDAWTEAWARELASAGVGPEVRVGVAFERSVAMVAALLAVWR